MAYWWVNHKQTRDHEIRGQYLWSPKCNANGARNQSYDNMTRVQPGDVVFSYANGYLGAIGRATSQAYASPKPAEFGSVGDYWSNEGWLVDIHFVGVTKPIRPREHLVQIGPLLPIRHSPIQPNGNGNQGIYLAAISDVLGLLLIGLLGAHVIRELDEAAEYVAERFPNAEVLADIHGIESDTSLLETQRVQLAKARIGQGLFRKRVVLLDGECRVTGVTDQRVLIASHIKPWRTSTNAERLNGHNGILLSPHVDALFDEHLITFENDGQMHVHSSLPRDVLNRWSINPEKRVGKFRKEQHEFLANHRAVFSLGL
ncbi:HNH endonuclease signature motif containing protein [Rudaea sp.]|uniref:HNH endonuclease n=1 Tax=Rudaea sp. TaxID=2136325 RepID=UPI00321F9CE8